MENAKDKRDVPAPNPPQKRETERKRREMDENQLKRLEVLVALMTVDYNGLTDATKFERAVIKRTLTIDQMLGDDSIVMDVLDAQHIPATIQNIEFEKNTTRYVVTFLADNEVARGSNKPETIRTDRTDGARGAIVKSMWTQSLIGQHVLIYKKNDIPKDTQGQQSGGGSGNRQMSPNGYRRAVYVTKIPARVRRG